MNLLHRLKPALPKHWLMILAGLMWTGVGVLLCRYAFGWLMRPPSWSRIGLGLTGVVAAVPVYRLGFAKLARSNLARIRQLSDRACLFSFMAWKSYAVVAVMMTAGILLRNSAIPKHYLAVLYAAIGGGLFLASFVYYGQLSRLAWRSRVGDGG
ncbi:MAG: hypothetical protein BWY52_02145 [Chloroflexi bacterium ADurb.Bin325]|nr:MAG: hypothetical protein BWY52_02145 [Chloroflexi bacterium ADurb.Bin325]